MGVPGILNRFGCQSRSEGVLDPLLACLGRRFKSGDRHVDFHASNGSITPSHFDMETQAAEWAIAVYLGGLLREGTVDLVPPMPTPFAGELRRATAFDGRFS